MQLIVRITSRCNFKCTFCSASKFSTKCYELSDEDIIDILKHNPNIDNVIFEGGDPLVVSPERIKALMDTIEKEFPNVREFGITSNLWDFYKRPYKWTDILKRENLTVTTSFQYGDGRRISDKLIFDESLFRQVYAKFKDLVGKDLPFISVISVDNEDKVSKTIALAKELGTTCKLNRQLALGRAEDSYPFHKMIRLYTDNILNGDYEYEDNSYNLRNIVKNGGKDNNSCPFCIDCKNGFITVNPDKTQTYCSMIASYRDCNESVVKFYDKVRTYDTKKHICDNCLTCRAFDICNSCLLNKEQIDENVLETHCNTILDCYDKILES